MKHLYFLFFMLIGAHDVLSMERGKVLSEERESKRWSTLNFEHIRAREGGFKSSVLKDARCIYPAGDPLNATELEDLVTSTLLINLKDLSLSHQSLVNDDTIQKFSQNPTFSRIMSLDLTATSITKNAFDTILESEFLGRRRTTPFYGRISGVPCSIIKITMAKTSLDDEIQYDTLDDKYLRRFDTAAKKNKLKKNFEIHYDLPEPRGEILKGIKVLDIKRV